MDATLALHGEVGPARTTIAAIAERAGVSRPTVDAQFPDERSLFEACGSHFRGLHPPPDLEPGSPDEALGSLYEYYRENSRALEHVDRDARGCTALADSRRPLTERLERFAEHHGRAVGGGSLPVAA